MENDLVGFLGRLLSSRAWRQRFAVDASRTALEFGLTGEDFLTAIDLDLHQLEQQAQLLIRKRFHEVRRLEPRWCSRLGDAAWPLFVDYCETFWPSGHRRHFLDAAAFRAFVKEQRRQRARSSRLSWWRTWKKDLVPEDASSRR